MKTNYSIAKEKEKECNLSLYNESTSSVLSIFHDKNGWEDKTEILAETGIYHYLSTTKEILDKTERDIQRFKREIG